MGRDNGETMKGVSEAFVSRRFVRLDPYRLSIPIFDGMRSFFNQRGVIENDQIRALVNTDVERLIEGLDLLFEANHQEILSGVLPDSINQVLQKTGTTPVIDHVGIEVFGPLEIYLDLLRKRLGRFGLVHQPLAAGNNITADGDMIFSSTAVVKDLQKLDSNLQEVKIARMYFTDKKHPERGKKCFELFQATGQQITGTGEQAKHTMETRLANLYAVSTPQLSELIQNGKITKVNPIDHLSIVVDKFDAVLGVHRALLPATDESGQPKRYLDQIGFNPSDRSINTKIINPQTAQIQEVVYYAKDDEEFNLIKNENSSANN